MGNMTPLSVLLIDDDAAACADFQVCGAKRRDVRLVGVARSGMEGLELVRAHTPSGIVLSLELSPTVGGGLHLLGELRDIPPVRHAIVAVATKSDSALVLQHVYANGADLVVSKGETDYGADRLLDGMLTLRDAETPEARQARLMWRVGVEMDQLGMDTALKGRQYLEEAICLLLSPGADTGESVIDRLSALHMHAYSSMARAMQTAIHATWRAADLPALQAHYTARVRLRGKGPSPAEFIYYYVEKLRKTL